MIEIGIIGFSKNNGHPYSFSAIINGYNKTYFKKVGYKFILEYLNKQPKKNFLKNELKISDKSLRLSHLFSYCAYYPSII